MKPTLFNNGKLIHSISELFDPAPEHWGLRGDPYLWEELKKHFKGKALQSSADEFQAELHKAVAALIGVNLHIDESTFVERFSHGGMSSGSISHGFWLEFAFPMLLNRFLFCTSDEEYSEQAKTQY